MEIRDSHRYQINNQLRTKNTGFNWKVDQFFLKIRQGKDNRFWVCFGVAIAKCLERRFSSRGVARDGHFVLPGQGGRRDGAVDRLSYFQCIHFT